MHRPVQEYAVKGCGTTKYYSQASGDYPYLAGASTHREEAAYPRCLGYAARCCKDVWVDASLHAADAHSDRHLDHTAADSGSSTRHKRYRACGRQQHTAGSIAVSARVYKCLRKLQAGCQLGVAWGFTATLEPFICQASTMCRKAPSWYK
jgi:hypothetical protein